MEVKDIHNAPKYAGIYLFRNKVNNKYYVGQSIKLRQRLMHHINNFNRGDVDAPLYKAFTKYGLENFEVLILDTFRDALNHQVKEQLDVLEKKYIQEYNSYGPTGYNQTLGGDAGIIGYKFTPEQLDKQSRNTHIVQSDGRNLIYCYDTLDRCYYTAVSKSALSDILKVKLESEDINNTLVRERYLLARSKEALEEKKQYFLLHPTIKNKGRFVTKLTDSMREDILNGMDIQAFLDKYKVCKMTYYNYKKKLNGTA